VLNLHTNTLVIGSPVEYICEADQPGSLVQHAQSTYDLQIRIVIWVEHRQYGRCDSGCVNPAEMRIWVPRITKRKRCPVEQGTEYLNVAVVECGRHELSDASSWGCGLYPVMESIL
jgi:hypothetical protein